MISEKEVLKFMKEDAPRPMKRKELVKEFKISSEERVLFRRMLKNMARDGVIIKIKGGRYGVPEKMNLVTGTLQCHPDGFGFVIPEATKEKSGSGSNDIYVSPRNIKEAMHGDKVVCRVESRAFKGKEEGRIVQIIERGHTTLVGTFERTGNFGFVVPNERRIAKDIYISNKFSEKAKPGQAVVVEITQYPMAGRNPEGKIIEVLGYPDSPEVEFEMIIRKHGLANTFPEKVLEEAENIPMEIPDEEYRKRKDLRELLTVTIDGETAKDFDDAISIEKLDDGGFRLYVHIADVSHYVIKGSVLDDEAYERGTSVYFLDRVIPMLPQKLSNEICSLKPGEDRLTMTAVMDINAKGEALKYDIYNSVINSNERMTYTDVAKILEDNDEKLKKRYDHLLDMFSQMKELCGVLNKKRAELGSVDFDLPEPDIIINREGRIENILKAERNIAHRIIEEFMLYANVIAAKHIFNAGIPGIYRVHEKPDLQKVLDFSEFIHNFGYSLENPQKVEAKSLRKLLVSARGEPSEKLINHILLRSMKQAVYSEKNSGHFCLAFDCYTHFTSPIRRYPDLTTHRVLKILLAHKKVSPRKIEQLKKSLPLIAEHSSERERNAMDAEREIIDLNKVRFMMDKTGETFSGFITGVTAFGIFVELEDMFVEGLVHVNSMKDDYYIYHEKKHSLIGDHKNKVYRIGDEVKIAVESVSIEKRQIDFVLVP